MLDSWPGVGHVAVGMHRQGFDLQLTQYDERSWRATFYTTGMEHSPTSTFGTAWERTVAVRTSCGRGHHAAEFMVFDLLHQDGLELTGRPLRDRRARLENVVAGSESVLPVRRLAQNGFGAWAEVVAHDCEGLVATDEESL